MQDHAFDFRNLFVLDLANNHQGSVQHGLNVIRSIGEVVAKHHVRAAIKFQFRQLDSFIHPAHQQGSELKFVKRFMSTKLSHQQFETLHEAVRAQGMISLCTPFDEASVGVIDAMGFDGIKVASCSAKDWPLLEEVASAGKPTIISTGGLDLPDIDNLVSFFEHRGVSYALMHCVSIYPTPDELLHLNQIRMLKERYPDVPIGWSTHEDPNDTLPVQLAVALGADLFERHVGFETDEVKLNAYSSTADQVSAWLGAHSRATVLCGSHERPAVSAEERNAIDDLRRGVYAREPIARGEQLDRSRVYFAMPFEEGQLESGLFRDGIIARADFEVDQPVLAEQAEIPSSPGVHVIKQAVHEVKAMLNEARIALSSDFKVEYSHHYGSENFRRFGAVLIECVNRAYCKKLVVQLPGQRHPSHYHRQKEETFQVLHGVLECAVDGKRRELFPGDTLLIQPGVWHSFSTQSGVVFEEVSTADIEGDSIYGDQRINKMTRSQRKTVVDHWGRFQINEGADGTGVPAPPES